jgi:hypothetical protein
VRPRALLVVATIVALACGGGGTPPDSVTTQFWQAIQDRDIEAAAELATASSPITLARMRDGRPIDEILIGETLTGQHTAVVRTSLATHVNDRISHTTFDTHLVRDGSRWLVDIDATQQSVTTALFATSMKEIGEVMGRGVQEFSDALGQGAEDVSRAIQEALEELNRELQ